MVGLGKALHRGFFSGTPSFPNTSEDVSTIPCERLDQIRAFDLGNAAESWPRSACWGAVYH